MAKPTPTSTLDTPSHSELHNAYVDVKMFSAVGDGVADDTAEILAAIAALPSTGGTIFFPQGIYKVTSTITEGSVSKPITFRGAGNNTTHLKGSGITIMELVAPYSSVQDLTIYGNPSHASTVGLAIGSITTGMAHVGVQNVTIVGTSQTGKGVRFDFGLENSFTNVVVLSWATGVELLATGGPSMASNANSFHGCKFRECTTGILATGAGPALFGCTLEANDLGLSIGGGATKAFGCWFENQNGATPTNVLITANGPFTSMGCFYGSAAANRDIVITSGSPATHASFHDLFNSGITHGGTGTLSIREPWATPAITGAGPVVVWQNNEELSGLGVNFRWTGIFDFLDGLTIGRNATGSGRNYFNFTNASGMQEFYQDEANARVTLSMNAGPGLYFGDGSAVADVGLTRSAANVMSMAAGDSLRHPGTAHGSLPAATGFAAGSQFYCTTDKQPLWSDGTNWVEADGTNH